MDRSALCLATAISTLFATDALGEPPPTGWHAVDGAEASRPLRAPDACKDDSPCAELIAASQPAPDATPHYDLDVPLAEIGGAKVLHFPAETAGPNGAIVLRTFGVDQRVPEWDGQPEPMNALPPRLRGLMSVEGTDPIDSSLFRFTAFPMPGDPTPRATIPFTFMARGNTKPDGTIAFDWLAGTEDARQAPRVRTWVHGDAKRIASRYVYALRLDEGSGDPMVAVLIDSPEIQEMTVVGGDKPSANVGIVDSWMSQAHEFPEFGISKDIVSVFADLSHGDGEGPAVLRIRIR